MHILECLRLMQNGSIFKKCNNCGFEWKKREEFLSDPDIDLIGYQINTSKLIDGLILFNHGCCSTLSVKVKLFLDLYTGKVHHILQMNEDGCPGYCSEKYTLRKCTNLCEGTYIREIIQTLKNWSKACQCTTCHCTVNEAVQSVAI